MCLGPLLLSNCFPGDTNSNSQADKSALGSTNNKKQPASETAKKETSFLYRLDDSEQISPIIRKSSSNVSRVVAEKEPEGKNQRDLQPQTPYQQREWPHTASNALYSPGHVN